MFFEIARIAKIKKPKYLLLENVPGLLNHDSGRTFATIIQTLDNLGYDVAWQVLNSADYGVAQSRRRVYIVGYDRKRCWGEVLSFAQTSRKNALKITPGRLGERIYSSDGLSCTLTSGSGGFGGMTGLYLIENFGLPIKVNTKAGFQMAYPGDSIDTAFIGKNSRHSRVGHQIAHTLTTVNTMAYFFVDLNPDPKLTKLARCITARYNGGISNRQAERSGLFVEQELADLEDKKFAVFLIDKKGKVHIGRIRKLIPLECWRLQGFTDEQFYKAQATGLSDSRLYKMAGNAVSVPVITAIGRKILAVEKRNIK